MILPGAEGGSTVRGCELGGGLLELVPALRSLFFGGFRRAHFFCFMGLVKVREGHLVSTDALALLQFSEGDAARVVAAVCFLVRAAGLSLWLQVPLGLLVEQLNPLV